MTRLRTMCPMNCHPTLCGMLVDVVRFNRAALPSLACIDRREAQPDWTIAIGLSLCSQPVGVA